MLSRISQTSTSSESDVELLNKQNEKITEIFQTAEENKHQVFVLSNWSCKVYVMSLKNNYLSSYMFYYVYVASHLGK